MLVISGGTLTEIISLIIAMEAKGYVNNTLYIVPLCRPRFLPVRTMFLREQVHAFFRSPLMNNAEEVSETEDNSLSQKEEHPGDILQRSGAVAANAGITLQPIRLSEFCVNTL